VAEANHDSAAQLASLARGTASIDDMTLVDPQGREHPFREVMDGVLKPIPVGARGRQHGTRQFDQPHKLRIVGEGDVTVLGFDWQVDMVADVQRISTGLGIGGLVAELVLRTLDDEIHQLFSNRDIARFGFGPDGTVRPLP
jgi:hypothetical protein